MSRLPQIPEGPLPGLGRAATDHERDKLDKYLTLLIKWQKAYRLVGSADPAWIVENLFLDSFCFLEALPPETRAIADVGSGAGIPGVPIAIARPDLALSLIEARRRRASFLSTVVRELGLSRVQVLSERVESLVRSHQGRFDAVVMRCAGPPPRLLPMVFPLLRSGGVVVVSAKGTEGPAYSGGEAIGVRTASGGVRRLLRYSRP